MMQYQIIKPMEERTKLTEYWSPKYIGEMNDYQFKLVKMIGEYEWHAHEETDKLFVVLDGVMIIDLREGQVKIAKGEMFVVPKGLEIKPSAESECHIMLMEPKQA